MAYNKQNPTNSPDVKAQIMKYAKYWYFFGLALLLGLGGAWFYLQTQVPKYKVTSSLLVQDDSKGDGLLKGTAFSDLNMFKTSKTVDDEMEVMRSRDLIYKVLSDLKMNVRYHYNLPLKTQELYGKNLPMEVVVDKLTDKARALKLTLRAINNDQFVLGEKDKETIYRFGNKITRPQFTIVVQKGKALRFQVKLYILAL
ncbi:hypothetical protein [Pedobacter panaciterrae]